MYNNTYSSRNPWGDVSVFDAATDIDELKKAIREQKILLAAAGDDVDLHQEDSSNSMEELQKRIISVTQELHDQQQLAASRGSAISNSSQWWQRYQTNLRHLEDLADQKQALLKEIDYLVGTGLKNLEDEIKIETERLNAATQRSGQVRRAIASNYEQPGMTESERIRAKAQAMVAARLGRNSSSTTSYNEEDTTRKTSEMNKLIDAIKSTRNDVEHIIQSDLTKVDQHLDMGTKLLKDRQMFEQGLYVDDELARFIDRLNRNLSILSASEKKYYPPSKYSTFPPLYSKSTASAPPIPTSQRPGTPRSEADIKAAAYKRIEERRKLFVKDTTSSQKRHEEDAHKSALADENKISDEERAAQERMRQAEADARARLDAMREKRNKLRKEAAEAEERKKRAAAEASAAAEAEMLAEKKRKQQEEEERLARIKKAQDELAEQQRILREAEIERLRLEREERERKEAEERKIREEKERKAEEIRQMKARKAAEQAAHEKRLRRSEIERREREIEAARQEEINRRKQWEEAENQKRLDEERRIREKEEEAARIKKLLDEEDARAEEQRRKDEEEKIRKEQEAIARKREEEERLRIERLREEEAIREAERKLEDDRKLEALRRRQREERALAAAKAIEEAEKAEKAAAEAATAAQEDKYGNMHTNLNNNTTAGTSGYGVDIEDEVNFTISK